MTVSSLAYVYGGPKRYVAGHRMLVLVRPSTSAAVSTWRHKALHFFTIPIHKECRTRTYYLSSFMFCQPIGGEGGFLLWRVLISDWAFRGRSPRLLGKLPNRVFCSHENFITWFGYNHWEKGSGRDLGSGCKKTTWKTIEPRARLEHRCLFAHTRIYFLSELYFAHVCLAYRRRKGGEVFLCGPHHKLGL